MKEVVWVFGTSGSGKETFIKHVPDDKLLLRKLGWADKKVVVCNESIEYIGQFNKDPITLKREKIQERVPILLDSSEVVLIKWQYVDSKASIPKRLKEQLPNVRHRIIALKAPVHELEKRLANKNLVERLWDRKRVYQFRT